MRTSRKLRGLSFITRLKRHRNALLWDLLFPSVRAQAADASLVADRVLFIGKTPQLNAVCTFFKEIAVAELLRTANLHSVRVRLRA